MNRNAGNILGQLVACLLGMALTTAWFQSRNPYELVSSGKAVQAKLETTESKPSAQSTVVNSTGQVPWKRLELGTKIADTETQDPESEGIMGSFRTISADWGHRIHAERISNLKMTLLLGLTPEQAEALARGQIKEEIDPFGGSDQVLLRDILTPSQAETYQRMKERLERCRAETDALPWVHRLARAIELNDDQREQLFHLEAKMPHGQRLSEFRPFAGIESEPEDSVKFQVERFDMAVREILSDVQYEAYEELERQTREINQVFLEELRTWRLGPFFPDAP